VPQSTEGSALCGRVGGGYSGPGWQEVTKLTLFAVATDEHNESRAGCNHVAWLKPLVLSFSFVLPMAPDLQTRIRNESLGQGARRPRASATAVPTGKSEERF
jgi:hypothetical protein